MAAGNEFVNFAHERATGGEVVDVLSTRNGKLVEHVTDEQGDFVRRTYLPEAVDEIERAGVGFLEAWQVYNEMLGSAGVDVVESGLVEETLDDDPIIVARYLGSLGVESRPKLLSFEAKTQLAEDIGKLLTAHPDFLPDPQGLLPDAFAIDPETERPVLIDIDPYVKKRRDGKFGIRQTEAILGAFMRRGGWNIAEWASTDEERTAMATAFCRSAGEVLDDDSSMELLGHFSYVHFMSNGMSPRELDRMGL